MKSLFLVLFLFTSFGASACMEKAYVIDDILELYSSGIGYGETPFIQVEAIMDKGGVLHIANYEIRIDEVDAVEGIIIFTRYFVINRDTGMEMVIKKLSGAVRTESGVSVTRGGVRKPKGMMPAFAKELVIPGC